MQEEQVHKERHDDSDLNRQTEFEKYVFFVEKEDVIDNRSVTKTMNSSRAGELLPQLSREGEVREHQESSSSRPSSWARNFSQSSRQWIDHGGVLVTQRWRERPRAAADIWPLVGRNAIAIVLIAIAGILTWEMTVDALRVRIQKLSVFPIYLPHAVALSLASVWDVGIAPGNLLGLYLARMYMNWRGVGLTTVNSTVMFVVALVATMQSHVGAYYLRKCLCCGRVEKRIPTIDSVADAVWFLMVATLTSLVFCTVITLCITISPLAPWSGFWLFWGTSWLAVLSAMITVTPLIIHLWGWKCQPSFKRPRKLLEFLVVMLVSVGILTVIFFFSVNSFRPLPYLCFPLITFTAFRFNRVGWAFTVTGIAYSCALGTIRKRGAVYAMTGRPEPGSGTLTLQIELFSIVMGVVSITLAAAVREKKILTRTLHQMNVELENKVDRRTMELQKANDELKISQKRAEMASHAKSDFLANMSHEIRTPIHGILGLTALLLESELTPDQKESLTSVKECADLLLHIINSVLDLAKIEAGRLEVERVPFNIRKMVSSTFRMLQARAQERGLKLYLEVDRGVPHSLVGDVGKLQQCLLNLVGNALKFTHEGSISVHVTVASDSLKASMMRAGDNEGMSNRVGIAPSNREGVGLSNRVGVGVADKISVDRPVSVAQTPESLLVHLEVRDTGIGINQEKLKDMFKPFTQADASTSRLYGGTGLGLCIVHRFVELLGGIIWAESEVGKGSAFHICLPLFLNTPSPKEGSREASPRVRSPGKVSKSWSLMGGLVFNHPGLEHYTGADSGPHSRSSRNASRVPSVNDLQGMWEGADSTVISIDDPSVFGDMVSTNRQTLSSNGRPCLPGSTQHSLEPDRQRRASGSDYEAYKESQNGTKSHFDYAHSRARLSQVHGISNWDCKDGDRGLASNDVTASTTPSGVGPLKPDSLELVPLQSMMLPPLRTGRLTDAFEVIGVYKDPSAGDMTGESFDHQGSLSGTTPYTPPEGAQLVYPPPPSELSRESSTELEKMLENKLQLKILLAEDNAINQKVASRQLEKHGHVVTIVGDGQQALDAVCAQHDQFDLVLMDVQVCSCSSSLQNVSMLDALKLKLKLMLSVNFTLDFSSIWSLSIKRFHHTWGMHACIMLLGYSMNYSELLIHVLSDASFKHV
ncbi:hypothetical protein KC19_7G051500 [Ceratodon purpureus]|uniref:histidine kinase n=1 Tax=Ceratodon purpureus TaxID=3225 RepID=A0A8T0H300_CERPU|nr:hypothetical protein KC19_7G051500 [Ceratodon purpureus]